MPNAIVEPKAHQKLRRTLKSTVAELLLVCVSTQPTLFASYRIRVTMIYPIATFRGRVRR